MGTYNAEVGTLVVGVVKVKGTDTVAPGTFSFKEAPPFYLRTPGEHEVTVVFKPDDLRLHKPTETTIKINAIKNTIKDIDEPEPITDKPLGTPFAELGLPENVCINGVDGAWRWIEAAWDESSYDAESSDWQTITGTLVLGEDDGGIFQQPEPAVTAAIRVKLTVPDSPPTVTTETLPGGTEGETYSQTLTARGTAPITWSIASGTLPKGLSLNETTGEISGTPAGEETAVFTVKAVNALGEDTKELSITIAKAPEPEYSVTVSDDGHGTGSADPASATAGTEITLSAVPEAGYRFREWKVISGGVTVTGGKFTMPGSNVEVMAIFELIPAVRHDVTVSDDGHGTGSADPASATAGTEITLSAVPKAGYRFKEWKVISGGVTITGGKFTMPDSSVEVMAVFEPIPAVKYDVTVKGSYASASGTGSYSAGETVTIRAGSRKNYAFNGWTSDDVDIADPGSANTSFVMPDGDVTVTANWRYTGKTPKTGDSEDLALFAALLLMSGAGLVSLVLFGKKRRGTTR